MENDEDATVSDYVKEEIIFDPKENYADDFIANLFKLVGAYGWIIFLSGLLVTYIWMKYIQNYVKSLMNKREESYDKKIDPQIEKHRQEKLRLSRLKLQEHYEERLQNFIEEKNIKQKEKFEAAVNKNNLDTNRDNTKNTNYKPEYNPLMGSSSLPSYRPPKRTACSKGNCG